MWLFTQHGMVSIVRHRDEPELLLVRARRRDHLEALLVIAGLDELTRDIFRQKWADYEFRLLLPDSQLKRILAAQVVDIDYDNFKARCDRIADRGYASALHQVWHVMYEALAGRRNRGEFDDVLDKHAAGLLPVQTDDHSFLDFFRRAGKRKGEQV